MFEVIMMPVWFFYVSLAIMLASGVLGTMWAQRQKEKRDKEL